MQSQASHTRNPSHVPPDGNQGLVAQKESTGQLTERFACCWAVAGGAVVQTQRYLLSWYDTSKAQAAYLWMYVEA